VVNMISSAYKMWHHGPFDDVQSQRAYVGIQAYAHAKLLNLTWAFALAEQLRPHEVAVNATNPGAAWTPGTAQLTPEAVSAWTYVWPLVRFFQRRGSRAKAAAGPNNQRRVIDLAQALLSHAPTARPSWQGSPRPQEQP
jgi:NAD(P)-dependent dehydrogenase (short-subunit alcohol dehydrogenase family)